MEDNRGLAMKEEIVVTGRQTDYELSLNIINSRSGARETSRPGHLYICEPCTPAQHHHHHHHHHHQQQQQLGLAYNGVHVLAQKLVGS